MTGDRDLLHLLREERERRRDLARDLELHLALVAARAEEPVPAPVVLVDEVRARLARGEPALAASDLQADWPGVVRLALRVCDIVARSEPTRAPALTLIAERLSHASPGELLVLVTNHLENIDGDGRDGDSQRLLGFVLSHALRPYLRARVTAVAPLLPDGGEHRRCPACGGAPDLAVLPAEGGPRRLLCSRCDTEWSYGRRGCPFCGNDTPESLGYLATDDGAYGLDVCERCKRYLKTVDLRGTRRRRPLPLERILTAGMDLAAAQEGFRVGP